MCLSLIDDFMSVRSCDSFTELPVALHLVRLDAFLNELCSILFRMKLGVPTIVLELLPQYGFFCLMYFRLKNFSELRALSIFIKLCLDLFLTLLVCGVEYSCGVLSLERLNSRIFMIFLLLISF